MVWNALVRPEESSGHFLTASEPADDTIKEPAPRTAMPCQFPICSTRRFWNVLCIPRCTDYSAGTGLSRAIRDYPSEGDFFGSHLSVRSRAQGILQLSRRACESLSHSLGAHRPMSIEIAPGPPHS